jgi:integrase/recombinase XerD
MIDALKAIDNFISYVIVEKGQAKNTALAYRSDLMKFNAYAKSLNKDIGTLVHQDITDFLWNMKTQGLSAETIYRMIASIRQFYKFLNLEDILQNNPAEDVPVPKLAQKLPQVLTIEEVDTLLSSVNENTDMSIRNRAMFEMLYATGLRNTELITLKFSNINMEENFLKVLGKGSKERLAPFGETAKRFLQIYLAKRKPALSPDEYVFLSRINKPLSRVSLWIQINAAGKKAGIAKSIHPHILRHSCASHLLAGGADIRFVQEILGHSSITSTQIYTHLDATEIQEKHKKFHPRG